MALHLSVHTNLYMNCIYMTLYVIPHLRGLKGSGTMILDSMWLTNLTVS